MNFNFFQKSSPDAAAEREFELEVKQEFFRQLRLRFYISLAVSTASTIVALSGVVLLYFGQVSEATLIGATGVLSSIVSINSLKETKELDLRLKSTKGLSDAELKSLESQNQKI